MNPVQQATGNGFAPTRCADRLAVIGAALACLALLLLLMPAPQALAAQSVSISKDGFAKVGAQDYGFSAGAVDLTAAEITKDANSKGDCDFSIDANVRKIIDQEAKSIDNVSRAVTVNRTCKLDRETTLAGGITATWKNIVTDSYGAVYSLRLKMSNVTVYPHGNYLGTIPKKGITVLTCNKDGNNTYASARFCGSTMESRMKEAVQKATHGGTWPDTGLALCGVKMDLTASIVNAQGKTVTSGTFAYGCKDLDGNVLGKHPSPTSLPKYAESVTFRSGLAAKTSNGTEYVIHAGAPVDNAAGDGNKKFELKLLKTKDGTRVYGWQQKNDIYNSHANDDAASMAVGFSAKVKASGFKFSWAGDHCDTRLFDESKASRKEPVPVKLVLDKKLNGKKAAKAGQFSFTSTNTSPAKGEKNHLAKQTVGNDAQGKVTFSYGSLKFGTYTFSVKENDTDEIRNGSIRKDASTKTCTVSVASNNNGGVNVSMAWAQKNGAADKTFLNTSIAPMPATAIIPVEKMLVLAKAPDGTEETALPAGQDADGRDGIPLPDIAGKYTFTLAAKTKGAPLPAEHRQVVNPDADGGVAEFGEIEYTKAGTYVYTITESGSMPQVANDAQAAKEVTVEVQKATKGNGFTAEVKSADGTGNTTFTNSYAPEPVPIQVAIPVSKKLVASDHANEQGSALPDIAGKYTFSLAADSKDAPLPETGETTVQNPDEDGGTTEFAPIRFTKAGDYRYRITEQGTVSGIANDPEAERGKPVTIHVTQRGWHLDAEIDYGEADDIVFTNTYQPVEMPFTGQGGLPWPLVAVGIAAIAAGTAAYAYRSHTDTNLPHR